MLIYTKNYPDDILEEKVSSRLAREVETTLVLNWKRSMFDLQWFSTGADFAPLATSGHI